MHKSERTSRPKRLQNKIRGVTANDEHVLSTYHDRGFPAYVEPVSERRPVLLSEEHTTGRNGKRL